MYYAQLSFFAAIFFEVYALISLLLFFVRANALRRQVGREEAKAIIEEAYDKHPLFTFMMAYITGILIASLFEFIGMVIGAINWFKENDNFRYFAFTIINLLLILAHYKFIRKHKR